MTIGNHEHKVTPQAEGYDFTGGLPGQQKFEFAVKANGVALDPDAVNVTNCVGQNIIFTLGWLPYRPAIVSSNNPQWTLGGTYVNTNLPPLYSDASADYTNDPALLKAETTHGWWYAGQYNPVQLTAAFTEDVTFDNGQTGSLDASGLFAMHRPQVWLHQTNTNIFEALEHQHANGTQPIPDLDRLTVFNCFETNWIRSLFSGEAFVTQTFVGTSGNAAGQFDSQGTNYLDNIVEYGKGFPGYPFPTRIGVVPDVSTNQLSFGDSPTAPCNGDTWHHSQFSTYIRFQPAGGIPVTLGIVHWHNDGDTHLETYCPNCSNQDYVPQATLPGPYSQPEKIKIPEAAFDGFTGDNAFPTWLHTYH